MGEARGKIENIKPEDLILYENNARTHDVSQVEMIAESIRTFGFVSPVLIDDDNNVIAGHGRLAAAEVLGLDVVPCVRVSGLTDEERRAYILADNKLTELGGWNMDLLDFELSTLDIDMAAFGFELIEEDPAEPHDDDFTLIVPEEAKTKLGDMYRLGDHLLLCGDATDEEAVSRIIGGVWWTFFSRIRRTTWILPERQTTTSRFRTTPWMMQPSAIC